ncbi:hypothetical protein ACWFPY_35205 [Nocardia fluminea]
MVLNIRLRSRWTFTAEESATDALGRRWAGYDPKVSDRVLWKHNRGRWKLAEKNLDEQRYTTFSFGGVVVAVYRLQGYERVADAVPRVEKIALIGRPLGADDRIYRALIGSPVPTLGQNPVQYLPDPGADEPAVRQRAFLLTWNPTEYEWNRYRDAVVETAAGREFEEAWSTGNRIGGAEMGDRVFLLRQGDFGRGIVGAGTVRSDIWSGDHYSGDGGAANYVDVVWEHVVDVEDLLPKTTLQREIPEYGWTPQASGNEVPTDIVGALESLWSEHIGGIPDADGAARGGQGRVADAERRRLIENEAQDLLMAHYRMLGWTVVDTRYSGPYDAVATKGPVTVYLEAKGTQSTGDSVSVTRGEVDHARRNHGRCVMGILSGVRFDSAGQLVESSGTFRVIPFDPDSGILTPIDFIWEHGHK